MPIAYFKTAWKDVTSSPRWFSRILLLSLVSLIPVFGWIVVCGYLLGWARDIAWGAATPLPNRIFDNADGMLYRRGLFSLVLAIVCGIVPRLVLLIGQFVSAGSFTGADIVFGGMGIAHPPLGSRAWGFPFDALSTAWGAATLLAAIAAGIFAVVFGWVGAMRMSIYGRLSAGFQLGKSWAMIRRDAKGIVKIFGMSIACAAVGGAILTATCVAAAFIGMAAMSLFSLAAGRAALGFVAFILVGMGMLAVFLLVLIVTQFVSVLSGALLARALGYWTRQFDVPLWRGQDDPMPFEVAR